MKKERTFSLKHLLGLFSRGGFFRGLTEGTVTAMVLSSLHVANLHKVIHSRLLSLFQVTEAIAVSHPSKCIPKLPSADYKYKSY
jgi:hypothetical protein